MERQGFDDWVAAAAPRLHRSAFLLVGDWALAQDLVQHACAAAWSRWGRIDAPDAYAKAVMARTASSWWGRRWRGEVPTELLPEDGADPWADVDRREAVARALRVLPPRQRAVVVLRFFDDFTEAQTAHALGWPVGTVKSTTARALVALRGTDLAEEASR